MKKSMTSTEKGKLLVSQAPAVTYITPAGADFYDLSPKLIRVNNTRMDFWLSADRQTLHYMSTEQVTVRFIARRDVPPQRFLNGQIEVFFFDENLDPGQDPTVNRIGIVGTLNDRFCFYREVDYLDNGFPTDTREYDFRAVAVDGGTHTQIITEVGSPALLAD